LWFSDRLSNKCKMLLIDLEREQIVYYNRALVLMFEDFKKGTLQEYNSSVPKSEPVQLDYATNKLQEKIWGVSKFDKERIWFAAFTMVKNPIPTPKQPTPTKR